MREAAFGIAFPQPVGRDLGVIAKALFACAQSLLGLLALGDLALDNEHGLYFLRSHSKRRVAHCEIAPR